MANRWNTGTRNSPKQSFTCGHAEVLFAGQSCLLQVRLLLTQHLLTHSERLML